KPKKFSYNPKHLLRLPHRLLHPPSKSSLVVRKNVTRKSPLVGTVRSFKLTPSYRVLLDDVLKGRHLPPLGRKEFEDFLYFKEYSAENLYFYFWFADYERAWTRWANNATHNADPTSPIPSTATTAKSTRGDNNGGGGLASFPSKANPGLAMSYARAKKTFFTPGSPWELNLPQKTLQQLLHPSKPHPGPVQHPHPSALAAVKFEVDTYLNDSLTRAGAKKDNSRGNGLSHLSGEALNGGNAGRNRAICAILIGLSIIVAGLSPIILTSLRSTATIPHYPAHPHTAIPTPTHYTHSWNQRLTRLAAIPGLWFGFTTLICGLHGVCIVIFLFGDARQLYPYELRRPDISSPIVSVKQTVMNPNLLANEKGKGEKRKSVVAGVDTNREEGVTEFVKLPSKSGRRGSPTSPMTATTTTPSSKAGFFPFNEPTSSPMRPYHTPSSSSSHPTTAYSCPDYPDSPVYFDFDAMPLPPGMKFPPGWDHEQSRNRQLGLGTVTTSASTSAGDLARWKSASSFTSMQTTTELPRHSARPPPHSHEQGEGESMEDVDVETKEGVEPKSRMEKAKQKVEGWWGLDPDRTMLAPLTAVMDPVITRIQWVIFMRSAAVALVLSVIVACASLAVP
ncbi:7303_t:CDS:2, partial [Acaulospora colombiana]